MTTDAQDDGGKPPPEMEAFCAACRAKNPPHANFCYSCGRALGNSSPETTLTLHPVDAQGEEELTVTFSSPAHGAALIVKRGPNLGARYDLDAEAIVVGRHPESDIFLDDVTVSRRHAQFKRRGAEYLLRDVGSLNGTYVNGSRVEAATLSSGDEVQIGKFKFVYVSVLSSTGDR